MTACATAYWATCEQTSEEYSAEESYTQNIPY